LLKWTEILNEAINYIENNLNEKIDYKEVAKQIHCSLSKFQQMFTLLTDMPVSEYVRRRRMSEAARELRESDIEIYLTNNVFVPPLQYNQFSHLNDFQYNQLLYSMFLSISLSFTPVIIINNLLRKNLAENYVHARLFFIRVYFAFIQYFVKRIF
jgi:AraC-like DNA-binding protein